jgi:hypothetical protein
METVRPVRMPVSKPVWVSSTVTERVPELASKIPKVEFVSVNEPACAVAGIIQAAAAIKTIDFDRDIGGSFHDLVRVHAVRKAIGRVFS